MGSFAGTCAVSRLAINPGDKVFYIFSTKSYVNNTYDLMQILGSNIRSTVDAKLSLKKEQEFLERWADKEDISESLKESVAFFKSIIERGEKNVQFGWGEYDDYGGVEDVEFSRETSDDDEEEVSHLVLIRAEIAKKMIELGRKCMASEIYDKKNLSEYLENEAYCLTIIAFRTRCQLFGFQLLGRQYPEVDEYKEILKLQWNIFKETVGEYLREIRDTLEYKNWSWRVGLEYRILGFFTRKEK